MDNLMGAKVYIAQLIVSLREKQHHIREAERIAEYAEGYYRDTYY